LQSASRPYSAIGVDAGAAVAVASFPVVMVELIINPYLRLARLAVGGQ
jgi:hypothetical protein